MKTLLLGGVKSGKSTRALALSRDFASTVTFIATAIPFDDEMTEKIAKHKAERDSHYHTLEEPYAIDEAIRSLPEGTPVVLDCIPLWLNNMFFSGREHEIESILESFIARLPKDIVIVTNEIGLGVIPSDPLSRRYGTLLGRINTHLAATCDSVELLVAGIPVRIK